MGASRTGKWFVACYLAGGAVLYLAAVTVRPGVYSGSLHGKFTVEADETSSFVSLGAETEPAWCWAYPRNHRYQKATMTIVSERERTVQLDLTEGTWTCDGDKGKLDAGGLSRLLTESRNAQPTSPVILQQAQSLLSSLHQMHAGEFLRPRHHGYRVDKPVQVFYVHFTPGQNWGVYAVSLWLLVWPAYLVLFKQPSAAWWLTPRKAFLVTSGIVVTLDLVFIGIDTLFSPGGISEAMEFLIGLLNMPTWILLGDRAVSTWFGLAFGAVSWSALISAGSLLVSHAYRYVVTSDVPASDQPPFGVVPS